METYNPVGWFEIPTLDLERAEAFYKALLDIEFQDMTSGEMQMKIFPMHHDTKGTSGALVKHPTYTPSKNGAGVIIYFTTPNFDEVMDKVESIGGKIVFPKRDIGENGFIGGIEDTEGNHIAIHTRK